MFFSTIRSRERNGRTEASFVYERRVWDANGHLNAPCVAVPPDCTLYCRGAVCAVQNKVHVSFLLCVDSEFLVEEVRNAAVRYGGDDLAALVVWQRIHHTLLIHKVQNEVVRAIQVNHIRREAAQLAQHNRIELLLEFFVNLLLRIDSRCRRVLDTRSAAL